VKVVEDLSTHDKIALKSFHRPSTTDSDMGMRFMTEVEVLIHLFHPCIVMIVGYSLPTETVHARIRTTFAVNGSLRHALHRGESGSTPSFLDHTDIAIITYGIMMGMKFVHSRGVMHRDLKPENILIDSNRFAQIADLGSDRFVEFVLTRTIDAGTPPYMAPEMCLGEDYAQPVDVFSFAQIFYELLIGKLVFAPHIGLKALIETVSRPERPELPESMNDVVRTIILCCWPANPSERKSFDNILSDLERIQFQIIPKVDSAKVEDFMSWVHRGKSTETSNAFQD
jgi:serine/threonine protein kinase